MRTLADGLAHELRRPVLTENKGGAGGLIATAAVGLITEPTQANDIINSGAADLAFLARELLRDPYWPHHAAKTLGQPVFAPVQYGRVF